MLSFLFGKKKKKRSKNKGSKKPPASLIKRCKKYRIKITKKVGKRRIYKSVTVLKKQLKHKMRKVRKSVKRRTRFGGLFTPKTHQQLQQGNTNALTTKFKQILENDYEKGCDKLESFYTPKEK
jgi:hypothetical protein